MPKRRRLYDLYVVGKEVEFEDDLGNAETVWVQKLNKVEQEAAVRHGMSARQIAQEMLDEDSETFQAALAQMKNYTTEDVWRNVAISEELDRARKRISAQVAVEEEWSDEDRLQGLTDAWLGNEHSGGLRAEFILDTENEEARRVLDALKEYDRQCEELVERERERLLRDLDGTEEPKLLKAAAQQLVKQQINEKFVHAYQNAEIFYAVRLADDHGERYFESIDELDKIPDPVRDRLVLEFTSLMVDVAEGKDSGETGDSSQPSEPQTAEADSSLSSPVAVPA